METRTRARYKIQQGNMKDGKTRHIHEHVRAIEAQLHVVHSFGK